MAGQGFPVVHESFRFVAMLAILFFAACGQPAGNFDGSPDSGYGEEEIGLLRLTARQIVQLEKNRDYKTLYREYASKDFKQRVDLRKFLKLANCTETHLGGVQSYDRSSLKFVRKREGDRTVELLDLAVDRANGRITERFVFVREGLGFKVQSFRWLSTNTAFLGCLESVSRGKTPAGVPHVEVKVAPGTPTE